MTTCTVGIWGLGLIGGSLAKGLRAAAEPSQRQYSVLGWDSDAATREAALTEQVIDDVLTPQRLADCDIVVIAISPQATLAVITEHAALLRSGGLVLDVAGVKEPICRVAEPLAQQHGFRFIGGHPMAGLERRGYANSTATLFRGATMILCPESSESSISEAELADLKNFFTVIGFAEVVVTTAARHDRIIALTSQLPHIVSSAFIQSPTACEHRGFSAGSFHDLTRVARLDEHLWTELFRMNREPLMLELESLISRLSAYRDALANDNSTSLVTLLKNGRQQKEACDAE